MQFVADQQTETETKRRYNEASLTLLGLLEWDRVTAAAALVTLRGAVRYFCGVVLLAYEAREGRALWSMLRRSRTPGLLRAREWTERRLAQLSPQGRSRALLAWMIYLSRFAHKSETVRREFARVVTAPGMGYQLKLLCDITPATDFQSAEEWLLDRIAAGDHFGLDLDCLRSALLAVRLVRRIERLAEVK